MRKVRVSYRLYWIKMDQAREKRNSLFSVTAKFFKWDKTDNGKFYFSFNLKRVLSEFIQDTISKQSI